MFGIHSNSIHADALWRNLKKKWVVLCKQEQPKTYPGYCLHLWILHCNHFIILSHCDQGELRINNDNTERVPPGGYVTRGGHYKVSSESVVFLNCGYYSPSCPTFNSCFCSARLKRAITNWSVCRVCMISVKICKEMWIPFDAFYVLAGGKWMIVFGFRNAFHCSYIKYSGW